VLCASLPGFIISIRLYYVYGTDGFVEKFEEINDSPDANCMAGVVQYLLWKKMLKKEKTF